MGLVDRLGRDLILEGFMEWAWLFHQVELKLLCRRDHVAIVGLLAAEPGRGRARKVMSELCLWADCARATLEITPSDQWGADIKRLADFYTVLGFVPNSEPDELFLMREEMTRPPVRGRAHDRWLP